MDFIKNVSSKASNALSTIWQSSSSIIASATTAITPPIPNIRQSLSDLIHPPVVDLVKPGEENGHDSDGMANGNNGYHETIVEDDGQHDFYQEAQLTDDESQQNDAQMDEEYSDDDDEEGDEESVEQNDLDNGVEEDNGLVAIINGNGNGESTVGGLPVKRGKGRPRKSIDDIVELGEKIHATNEMAKKKKAKRNSRNGPNKKSNFRETEHEREERLHKRREYQRKYREFKRLQQQRATGNH